MDNAFQIIKKDESKLTEVLNYFLEEYEEAKRKGKFKNFWKIR